MYINWPNLEKTRYSPDRHILFCFGSTAPDWVEFAPVSASKEWAPCLTVVGVELGATDTLFPRRSVARCTPVFVRSLSVSRPAVVVDTPETSEAHALDWVASGHYVQDVFASEDFVSRSSPIRLEDT